MSLGVFAAGLGLSSIVGLGAYAALIEPQWIQVRRLNLALPTLPKAFEGYRILQISDLHIDSWLGKERLEEIVELINAQNVDLIAITGDFVSWETEDAPADLPEVLRNLQASDGVVGVPGNHDFYTDMSAIRQMMHEANIRDLTNDVFSLRREDAYLHIAGVDDAEKGSPDLDAVLNKLAGHSETAILLAHEPDFALESAPCKRFALQLSGHTHGGQVFLPIIGPLFLPEGGKRYAYGLHKEDDMLIYVNRGLGMVHLKMRLGCRPEVTVMTLGAVEMESEHEV